MYQLLQIVLTTEFCYVIVSEIVKKAMKRNSTYTENFREKVAGVNLY